MTPLLEEALNTNYVPTLAEINLIKHELAESGEKLSLLAAEIGRLQNRRKQLSVDKEHLSTGVATCRGILAPARRLIPEILREIFCHCLPTTHNAVMSALEAPLLLGRVCSHWRQIAYTTPRLWTSIHIVIPSPKPYNPAFPIDNTLILAAISEWLARSGVLPLSISMISSAYSQDPFIPTNGHIQPFFDLLCPFASRWRSVSFKLANYAWAKFFDFYRAVDVPLLEKLHFDGNRVPVLTATNPWGAGEVDFEATRRESGIFCAPRLRSVSIPRFAPRILQLPVRWSELLELDLSIGFFLLADIFTVLRLSPELRICSISISNTAAVVYAREQLTPPKTILSHLEVLALKNECWGEDMCILLETLITPQLCHLSYHQACEWGETLPSYEQHLMEALDQFLRGLVRPLQELELVSDMFSLGAVIGILELVPGLERLSVDTYRTHIVLSDFRHFYFTDQALRRFIPRVLTVQHQSAASVPHIGQGVADTLPDSGPNPFPLDEPEERLLSVPIMSSHPEDKVVVFPLCPKLKVLHCGGATFSESTFLEFLRARSLRSQELGVAHLKSVNVAYVTGQKPSEIFEDQVLKVGKLTGMNVYLTYTDPPIPLSLFSRSPESFSQRPSENVIGPPALLGFW